MDRNQRRGPADLEAVEEADDVERRPDEQLPRDYDDDEHARSRSGAREDPHHCAKQYPGEHTRHSRHQHAAHGDSIEGVGRHGRPQRRELR